MDKKVGRNGVRSTPRTVIEIGMRGNVISIALGRSTECDCRVNVAF